MFINPTSSSFQGKTYSARLTANFTHIVDRKGKKIVGKSKPTKFVKGNNEYKQNLRQFNAKYFGTSLEEIKEYWKNNQIIDSKRSLMPPF